MTTPRHPIDEADIRQRASRWAAAIRAMDLDGVMSIYAPDIVSFDIDPPLRCAGTAAKRERWTQVLAMYQRVHDHEVRDLAITVGDDSVPADLRSGRALLDLDP